MVQAMSVVELVVDPPRADLVLRRPAVLNAIDLETFDRLADRASEIARLADVRVVVVRGEGRSFSSGIDVSALPAMMGTPAEMIARAQEGFRRMAALPLPTIAAIQGHALGAGLQVALACDLRIAEEGAVLGLLEANYGLVPDLGGSTILPRLVGPARAKKMIWLAEKVSAEEAHEIGLVDVVAPKGALDAEVDRLAEQLGAAPAVPAREAKALIDRAHVHDTQTGMDAEAAAQERCMTAPDFADALTRGLERRRS